MTEYKGEILIISAFLLSMAVIRYRFTSQVLSVQIVWGM